MGKYVLKAAMLVMVCVGLAGCPESGDAGVDVLLTWLGIPQDTTISSIYFGRSDNGILVPTVELYEADVDEPLVPREFRRISDVPVDAILDPGDKGAPSPFRAVVELERNGAPAGNFQTEVDPAVLVEGDALVFIISSPAVYLVPPDDASQVKALIQGAAVPTD